MPEAETPRGSGGIIATESHHTAVHQGSQGRNLGGEIQQGIPALPTTAGEHPEGTAVIQSTVEIVGLIPCGKTGLQLPPEAVSSGGQKPDQQQRHPETPAHRHEISSRRRSS